MRMLEDRERKVSCGLTVPDVIKHGSEYGAGTEGGAGEGERDEEAIGEEDSSGVGVRDERKR